MFNFKIYDKILKGSWNILHLLCPNKRKTAIFEKDSSGQLILFTPAGLSVSCQDFSSSLKLDDDMYYLISSSWRWKPLTTHLL